MLSMGHVLIPQSDLRWSKQTDVAGLYFCSICSLFVINYWLLSHSLPCGYVARRGSTHSQPLSLSSALGSGVLGFCASLVRIFYETERSKRTESSSYVGRSRRQLGPRYSSYQHIVPERPTHVRLVCVLFFVLLLK